MTEHQRNPIPNETDRASRTLDICKTRIWSELRFRAILFFKECQKRNPPLGRLSMIVAIDGRCASGKTTLASALEREFNRNRQDGVNCTVLHMDDYFLRPEQRTPERLATPGGNVDYERLRDELLAPYREDRPAYLRRFDCKTRTLGEPERIEPTPLIIVEGSYACHPALREFYDMMFFSDIDPETQWERLLAREGEARAQAFRERWIPLEEAYFATCREDDFIRLG